MTSERSKEQAREWLTRDSPHMMADQIPSLAALLDQARSEGRTEVLAVIQRFQPAGSPPPGDWRTLIYWILDCAIGHGRSEALSEERERAVRIVRAMIGWPVAGWCPVSPVEALEQTCDEILRRLQSGQPQAQPESSCNPSKSSV